MAVTVGVGAWLAAHAFELLIAGIIALEAGASGYMVYDYLSGDETPLETPTVEPTTPTIGAYSVGGYKVTQTPNLLALQNQMANQLYAMYGYDAASQVEVYMGTVRAHGSPANAVANIDSWAAQTQQALRALGYEVEINVIKEQLLNDPNMWYFLLSTDLRYFNEEYVDYMARNIDSTIYPDIDADIRSAYEKEAQQSVKPPEGKKPSIIKIVIVSLFGTRLGRLFLVLLALTRFAGKLPGLLEAMRDNPIIVAVIIIALLLLLLIINSLRAPQSNQQQSSS